MFEDGSGRHNYTLIETFQRGEGPSPTINGLPGRSPPPSLS